MVKVVGRSAAAVLSRGKDKLLTHLEIISDLQNELPVFWSELHAVSGLSTEQDNGVPASVPLQCAGGYRPRELTFVADFLYNSIAAWQNQESPKAQPPSAFL